jgi:hypothetical protein
MNTQYANESTAARLKVLSAAELPQVSGGNNGPPIWPGMPASSALATSMAPWAMAVGAFAGGFAVGTYLNNTFGISSWIVDQLE